MFAQWYKCFKEAQQTEEQATQDLWLGYENIYDLEFYRNAYIKAKKRTVDLANHGMDEAQKNANLTLENKFKAANDLNMFEIYLKDLSQIQSDQVRVHALCFALEYLKDQALEAFKQSCEKNNQANDELLKVKQALNEWSSFVIF